MNIQATFSSDSAGYYLGGNNIGYHQSYIHNSIADGSTKYGAAFGIPRRCLVGGNLSDNGTTCGSRAVAGNEAGIYTKYHNS